MERKKMTRPLTKSRRWTEQELATFHKALLSGMTMKGIARKHFPNRTDRALQTKAVRMGWVRHPQHGETSSLRLELPIVALQAFRLYAIRHGKEQKQVFLSWLEAHLGFELKSQVLRAGPSLPSEPLCPLIRTFDLPPAQSPQARYAVRSGG